MSTTLRAFRFLVGASLFANLLTMRSCWEVVFPMNYTSHSQVLFYSMLVGSLIFMTGIWSRPVAFFLLVVFAHTYVTYQGQDRLIIFYLFYSFLIGDAKSPAVWAVRLMQVQMLLFYTFCVANKLYGDELWRNGWALCYVLSDNFWSRWAWPELLTHAWFIKPLTYAALASEGILPWLIVLKPTRYKAATLLIGFHVTMALCMPKIAFFTLSVIPGIVLLCCPKREDVMNPIELRLWSPQNSLLLKKAA